MTWRAIACVGAIACAAGGPRVLDRPELAGERVLTVPTAEQFTLPNGLRVVVSGDNGSNLVSVDMRYEVGAVEDPPGKAGLAHVVEHMMFELGREPPRLADRLSTAALSYNAYTSFDRTHYTAIGLRRNLNALIQIEAERMRASCDQLDATVFERELEVVRNELRQRDTVAARLGSELRRAVYGADHPYARAVGGEAAELGALELADVCEFAAAYYAPERAILVVSGNVRVDEVRVVIAAAFRGVLPRRTPRRAPIPAPSLTRPSSRHELAVDQATALIATPAYVLADRESALGEPVSAAFEAVVGSELGELDYVASFGVEPVGGARAPLHVASVVVTDPARLDDAVAAFFRAQKRVPGRLTAMTAPRLVPRAIARQLRRYESLARRGDMVADYVQYGGARMSLATRVQWMSGARVGQLARRAEPYFAAARSHVAYVYPRKGSELRRSSVAVTQRSRDYDIAPWRAAVDPTEHDRDLRLPRVRGRADAQSFRLDNGMTVVLAPDLDYPLVDIRIAYPVGTLHDPADKPGLARLTAAFLVPERQGAYWVDDLNFLEDIIAMGGEPSSRVTETTTTFAMRGLSIYTDGLLWQLGWLLERGEMSRKALTRYREAAERTDDDRARRARDRARAIYSALFGADHPYASVDDPRAEGIGVRELREFRRRHYQPDQAVLVVAGRFDVADIERRIRHQYGAWRGRSAATQARVIPSARARGRVISVGHVVPDASQVAIAFAFATAPGRDRMAARGVLAEMIELRMRALREQLASTYGVSVAQSYSIGPGALVVGGAFDAGRSAQALAAMRDVMTEVRGGEQLASLFARARRRVLRRSLGRSLSAAAVASRLAASARSPARARTDGDWPAAIARLRVADVQAVVAAELGPDRGIVLVSGPRAAIEATFAGVGVTDVAYLD